MYVCFCLLCLDANSSVSIKWGNIMSKENVRLFLKKATNDHRLMEKIRQLSETDDEEYIYKVIELGRESGYFFNREDMKHFVIDIMMRLEKVTVLLKDAAILTDEIKTFASGLVEDVANIKLERKSKEILKKYKPYEIVH